MASGSHGRWHVGAFDLSAADDRGPRTRAGVWANAQPAHRARTRQAGHHGANARCVGVATPRQSAGVLRRVRGRDTQCRQLDHSRHAGLRSPQHAHGLARRPAHPATRECAHGDFRHVGRVLRPGRAGDTRSGAGFVPAGTGRLAAPVQRGRRLSAGYHSVVAGATAGA